MFYVDSQLFVEKMACHFFFLNSCIYVLRYMRTHLCSHTLYRRAPLILCSLPFVLPSIFALKFSGSKPLTFITSQVLGSEVQRRPSWGVLAQRSSTGRQHSGLRSCEVSAGGFSCLNKQHCAS